MKRLSTLAMLLIVLAGTGRSLADEVSKVRLAPGDALPQDKWIDALGDVEPQWHVVSGEWRFTDEGLTTAPSILSRVMLPFQLDGGYDIKAEFTRTTGEGSVSIVLPVGRRQCQLFLAGWWQTVHGIGRIDGVEPHDSANPARWKPGKLTNDRRYQVEVSVRPEKDDVTINVALEGKPIIAWTGNQDSLSIAPHLRLPYAKRAGVGAYDSTVTFHVVSLRSVSGKATYVPRPDPPFEVGPEEDWTELLTDVDLKRDVVQGQWYQDEGAVAVAPGALKKNYMRLMLPEVVEGSYDLIAEFTRMKGNDSVTVMLPVGTKACAFHCSACIGGISGLERIDGKNIVDSHNPAIRRPGAILNGIRHKVAASVRRLPQGAIDEADVLIDVWLDGKPYIRWWGLESSLSLDAWKLPEPRRVGIGANVSIVKFHSVRLRRVSE